jgi:hypothetical protein
MLAFKVCLGSPCLGSKAGVRGRGCCDTDHKLSTHRQKVFVLDAILQVVIRQMKIKVYARSRKLRF